MPDPISPTGSPGQLPPVAQTQATSVSTPVPGTTPDAAKGGAVQQTAPSHGQDAVSVEIAKKAIEEQKTPVNDSIPNIEEATETLKAFLKNLPSDLQFKKDEETGTVMFKIINPVTKEVIREFPPEEVVEMTKKLRKLAQHSEKSGLLFDKKS